MGEKTLAQVQFAIFLGVIVMVVVVLVLLIVLDIDCCCWRWFCFSCVDCFGILWWLLLLTLFLFGCDGI